MTYLDEPCGRLLAVVHRQGCSDQRRDGLQSIVHVHEAADVSLHIRLVTRRPEESTQLYHPIGTQHLVLVQNVVRTHTVKRLTRSSLSLCQSVTCGGRIMVVVGVTSSSGGTG